MKKRALKKQMLEKSSQRRELQQKLFETPNYPKRITAKKIKNV